MKTGIRLMITASILLVALLLPAPSSHADTCVIQGYVFFHNNTAVPAGTSVNITNEGTNEKRTETTGGGGGNFYLRSFTCTQGSDVFDAFSWLGVFNGSNSGLATGLNLYLNITYDNIPPRFNATLPDQTMDEDNTTGIDNAFNLSDYSYDYDGSPLTYSIYSQSNSALVSASIDGSYVDIGAPAANQSGSSNVCVRAYDGEDYSSQSCFTITINPVPDNPSFTSASDNVSTSYIKGGAGVRITTVASDVDGDNVILYVCNTAGVTAAGCTGTQRCSNTAASNPSCTFTAESDSSQHSWHAFIYDATGRIAEDNYTGNYTTDSAAPTPGSVTVEGGNRYHSTDTTLDFVWSGFSDPSSGIHWYYYNFTDNSGSRTQTRVSNTTVLGSLGSAAQGNNTVYVWAEDSVGNIGSDANDWIWVDTVDPVLSGWTQNPSDLDEGSSGSLTVTVTVTDTTWNSSSPAQFRYKYDSAGWYSWQDMTDTGGGVYSYTMSEPVGGWSSHVGEILYYQVTATDVVGHTTTEQQQDLINVFNNAPVLDTIPNQVALESYNFSFIISASDIDNDTLTFSSDYNFTFDSINSTSAVAWWVPRNSDIGSNHVKFNVSDGSDTDSQTVTIDVSPTNDPPVLNPVGNLNAYLHVPFVHYIYGSDPDNENEYILDNQLLIFDKTQALRWFKIYSYFNVSNESYYGVINFTPLLSHEGSWNITIYVSDGTAIDSENITFTVGYCGDFDAGGEPLCDEDYENCHTCPNDCGQCSGSEDKYMTIIIDPRNCLGRNFTIWTYQLYNRATCGTEGLIVNGKEVCGNLSKVDVKMYLLDHGIWDNVDDFISDDNGQITLTPTVAGNYKLVASKRGYPNAFEYLEIGPCISEEEKKEQAKANETEKPAETEKPSKVNASQQPAEQEEVTPEASTLSVILWYIITPTLIIMLIVVGYYYYDKEKNNVAWILRARIWTVKNRKTAKSEIKKRWKQIKAYLGYDK